MNNIQGKQKNANSRNKRLEIKNTLSSLATLAKNRLNQNQILTELISIKTKKISESKDNLTKLSIFNSSIKNKNELKIKIINEIKSNNEELLSINKSLHEQINKLDNKYKILNNTFEENNADLINQLNLLKDRQFIYENVIKEKDAIIKKLKVDIFGYFLESYKIGYAIDIYNDEQSIILGCDNELSKNVNNYRDILLKVAICFNKIKNFKMSLKKQIFELKSHIKKINRYINTLNNLIANFDCLKFPGCCGKIIVEGEECVEEKKDINDSNEINSKIMNFTEESENYETSLLYSDEDLEKFNIINNPIIEKETLIKNKLSLPLKLDLSLINYNKTQKKMEDREKSLSRKNIYEKDIMSLKINKLKNDIKMNTEKKEILIEKKKSYKQKISEMRRKIKFLNESLNYSFTLRSVKRRNLKFNSSKILPIVYNNSISRNTKKLETIGFDNLNNIKSYYSNRFI